MQPIPTTPNYRVSAYQPPSKTFVFMTGWGVGSKLLSNLTDWLSTFPGSHTIRIATELNASVLSGADALILGSPYGSTGEEAFNATNAPVVMQTIFDWFNSSTGKFIWISGDSDYDGGEWINGNMTMLSFSLGSWIGLDFCAVEDPVSMAAASYRVVANETGTNANITAIVEGVSLGVLMHGPSPVFAFNGTHPVGLHNHTVPDIYNVLETSAAGVIVENNPNVTAVAHKDGQSAPIVMAAAQLMVGHFNNTVLVTGASPFGDYQPMFTDLYYDTPMHGSRFVKQALLWGVGISPDHADGPVVSALPEVVYGAFDLEWTAAEIENGFIVRYFIEVSNQTNFGYLVGDYNTTALSYPMNLPLGGPYYFRVRAEDDRGFMGTWSVEIQFTNVTVPPIDPSIYYVIGAVIFLIIVIIIVALLWRRKK